MRKRVPVEADLKIIRTMTSIGLSVKDVAAELGIGKATMERWRKDFPAINETLEQGRNNRRKRAYNCFFSQAFPVDEKGQPTRKGDSSLMVFWMKTRERWKEPPKDINISGSEERPIIEFAIKEPKNRKN
jgi:transcriptional regulator with XRE-family HTH domain